MDVNLQTLIGRNIRRFRLEDGLTIEELAFRAQLHPNYLGDVERGKRNPAIINLKKIADGLKRQLTELFSGMRGPVAAGPSEPRGKTAVYFSPGQEKDLISLIKILRNSSPKDRKRIIQIAKSLSSRLKNG